MLAHQFGWNSRVVNEVRMQVILKRLQSKFKLLDLTGFQKGVLLS